MPGFPKVNEAGFDNRRPHHSLTDSLGAAVEWHLTHSDWISIMHKQPEFEAWMDRNYQEREKPG